MPALTISTDTNPMPPRTPSPTRPPVSPITPPARPAVPSGNAPTDRPLLTHSQPDQTGLPPPAPEPIAFDSNPDVIALKSAISILQMQRQRAMADIQTLNSIKDKAVQDPEGFVRDLSEKRLQQGQTSRRGDSDDGSDDGDDDDDDDDAGKGSSRKGAAAPPEWPNIPTAQNVVRCPPINWSQYAVVGESLDKLHSEQLSRPSQGEPTVVDSAGVYQFKAGDGKKEKYGGVAAPYDPLQDKIDKKPKGKK